jgi:hypothetical protein
MEPIVVVKIQGKKSVVLMQMNGWFEFSLAAAQMV